MDDNKRQYWEKRIKDYKSSELTAAKLNIEKLNVGQEVVYTVEYTSGDTKYKAADIKVIGSVKLIDNGDEDRYGFIACGNKEDIFFTFENLAHSIRKQIKIGSKVSFNLKKKKQRREAYDIELAS